REARLIQRCDHPHLVKYIDFFVIKTPTQEEQYYLVLEYLEGMPAFSLRYRIKKEGRLEVEEAIPLFVNFLDALGFLHEGKKPIIHRDIKPTNLYAPKGTPDKARIFDLGVARDVTGTVTTGGVPGTLDYMAPEFSKPGGDRGAPQSDIYAIGLCLYEALTGQPAFEKLPMEINAAWMEFQKRSSGPMAISFDAPVFKEYPRLANVVRRATAKEPEDRYATAAEMIKALQQSLSAAPAAPEEGATMATLATRTSAEQMPRLSDADSLEATPTPQPEPARGAGKAPDAGRGRSKPAPRREEAPTPASSRSSPIDSAALHAEEEQDEDAPVTGATRMEGDAGAGVAWAKLHRSRRKLFVIGGAAAGGVLVLVLLIWLISGFSAQRAAGRVDDIVNDLKGVRAEAAYVGELQAGIEQLRAYSDKYPGMKNDVRNGIQALESAARNVPVKFKDAFALASVEKNVDAAQALQKEWEGLRPYREFLGISQDDFEERLDYMTRTAGRIGFEGVAGKLTASLPDAITDDASLDVVEAAAAQYRDLAARTSESLSPEDRKRQLEPMRAALTRLAAGYVATLRADALEHMASGVDAEVELSTFKAAATRAPATIALARQAFDAAAAEIDSAQGTVRAQQETERLFASISAAVAPADFEAVVKQFMAWESSTANPPPADKVKAAVEAIKAKYRQWGESYYKK
ncbi:MAG TPA: protein kinase, partial [Kiritimatiellia bacterium]